MAQLLVAQARQVYIKLRNSSNFSWSVRHASGKDESLGSTEYSEEDLKFNKTMVLTMSRLTPRSRISMSIHRRSLCLFATEFNAGGVPFLLCTQDARLDDGRRAMRTMELGT